MIWRGVRERWLVSWPGTRSRYIILSVMTKEDQVDSFISVYTV